MSTWGYEMPHERADDCPHAGVGKACAPCRGRFDMPRVYSREALLSDETVERAARALYETDREEEAGDEPWPTSVEGLNDMYRDLARTALTAAVGDE